jgi:hypothetical protein
MEKEGVEDLEKRKTGFNCLLNTRVNVRQRLAGRQFGTSRKCLSQPVFIQNQSYSEPELFTFKIKV